eukprot:c8627_g1_i2.p1 GENE.c8627_g1_i2~~c8627_g1_i2.p1  ORF type:complete len:212 (+),score=51.97 c8627_g1_i2:28-636(+)
MINSQSKPDPIAVAGQLGRFLDNLCGSAISVDSVFKCVSPPPIDILDYAERLGQFSRCSVEALQTTAVLLHRLHQRYPMLICRFSAHKLLAAALVVGIKFEDDNFYANSFYAECAGVCLQELNHLEFAFVSYLDFGLFVHPNESAHMGKYLTSFDDIFNLAFDDSVPVVQHPETVASKTLEMDVDELDFSWTSLLNDNAING